MTEQLKPCPFCGGKPLAYDMLESLSICTVECSGCDITVEGRTTEAAATKWNARALTTPQPAQGADVSVVKDQDGDAHVSLMVGGLYFDCAVSQSGRVSWAYKNGEDRKHGGERINWPTKPAQAGEADERVAFIEWLETTWPRCYPEGTGADYWRNGHLAALAWKAARASLPIQPAAQATPEPIPMVLHCPKCGMQHIDAPDERTPDWKNEPHRSHLCHGCSTIWRPADVPTTGVKAVTTKGKADTWDPGQAAQQAAGEPDVVSLASKAGLTWADGLSGSGFHINSADDLLAFYHHAVADFLGRTGHYVTNDVTREACIAKHLAEQAAGEPVAWLVGLPDEPELGEWFSEQDMSGHGYTSKPLFTHPAPGVPEGFALVPVADIQSLAKRAHELRDRQYDVSGSALLGDDKVKNFREQQPLVYAVACEVGAGLFCLADDLDKLAAAQAKGGE